MPYNESARDKKVRTRLEAWGVFQFGQSNDVSAFDGATACTHVVWQRVIYIWTGKKVTIDAISKSCGYYREHGSSGPRGLTVAESLKVVDYYNLPYVFKSTYTWEQLWDRLDVGPIPYAVRYGSEPDWKGYTYRGVRADGKPNGYAYKAGRTQLTGFENGPHMVLGGCRRTLSSSTGAVVRREVVRFDPNHNSPARPERPPYHLISSAQGKKEYYAYRDVLKRNLIAFVPTRSLPA